MSLYPGVEKDYAMEPEVLIQIEALRRASLASLRQRFREIFGEETGCQHREHLFRRIAWRLQSLAQGDLSERAQQRAHSIARDSDLRMIAPSSFLHSGGECVRPAPGNRNRRRLDPRLPMAGVLLSRNWKDRTILVEVLDRGFRDEGRYYSSLSAVASAVTGTRWNGLAFFGLNRPAKSATRKEPSHDEQ
jgi:hypothetical protein